LDFVLLACWAKGSAKADLNIYLVDEAPNLKVLVSGQLASLGSAVALATCDVNGALVSSVGAICTGTSAVTDLRAINGPTGFGGTASFLGADSVSGPSFLLAANFLTLYGSGVYSIDPSYSAGSPFLSSATFNNTSLAAQGFTSLGPVGSWSISGTSESINLFVGQVPGPLPLLGAGAAFGWSRRLRRRISASVITPPQA